MTVRLVSATLVDQAVDTATGWIERGCPPESTGHVLLALAQIKAQAHLPTPIVYDQQAPGAATTAC